MNEKIKELILLFTDAELILQKCRDLKANLSVELQAVRDDRKAQEKEFREFMAELWGTLDQIRARFLVDAQVLDLIRPHAEKSDQQKGIRKTNGNRDNSNIRINYSKPS